MSGLLERTIYVAGDSKWQHKLHSMSDIWTLALT